MHASPGSTPSPLISVVMPIYNAQSHLRQALASILAQDFEDFEVVAVNDGSTDDSGGILQQFAARDRRVRVIEQRNRGLVGALNRGLEESRGRLLARMDADDVAMPERFGKQVRFLQQHPAVLAVGTAIMNMDCDGDRLNVQILPTEAPAIDDQLMHRRTGLAHPSVMMRREAVEAVGGYRAEFEWIEDHDLWLRLSERGPLANLPDVLLCYRQHLKSCSWNNSVLRTRRINAVMRTAYQRRGLALPPHLVLDETRPRSAGGPHKWMRAATRSGQWSTAAKHTLAQWRQRPLSPLTLRSTIEAAARSLLTIVYRPAPLPAVPTFTADQLCLTPSPPRTSHAA
ncbi:glycosyltransferase family 2 protein [Roseimaritima sediminicola]|uniref:glycosyltransferase family 2 protein n=1 Tax=Roseimaritima sediminicola TaxID=2662066 RepID=UPI001386BE67|nr:glycosyltransferase [Roseimaritima sediminicola]